MKQLTVEDIARLAKIKTSSVRQHRQRGTLPEPDGYLGTKPYWDGMTVGIWLATRNGRGRPRKECVS